MEFKQYRGKSILAWLSYNANYEDPHGGINNRCYVYPRVMNGANYDPIDSTDFPKLGRIEVRIQGGDSADDVYSNFGPLVNIRINGDPYPNYDSNNMYSLKYNPQYGKANSEIWIESFSGKGFYQVIDVNSSIETIQSERSIPEPDCIIRTALILLRCEDKLYGPFECDTKEGMTALHGLKDYQYSVGEYAAMNYNDDLLVIEDQDGEEALILIPKVSVPSPDECEIRYDWISEEVLIDSFVDSLRVENSYTREQVRQLKEMVHQLVESGAGVQFTNDRIAKMQALLQSIGQKEEYVRDVVEYALTDESMKAALTEEVANNYKLFEYYCLLQLLKLLADNGYHKADIQEPAFKYLYTSADGHYQNEQDVANTYVLSRNHITATLYYQPVISAFNFENGLTLYRTTSKKGYYTPDFVLKFSFSEHDEEYIIFDAKFASRDTIKNFRLPEVIRKYSCELCVAANSRAPKMVWILQGRVNSNEKAIWRYHNSPLVSVCRPATSFGIVSVNTTIEIRQRLWNEIKSNILLLQ